MSGRGRMSGRVRRRCAWAFALGIAVAPWTGAAPAGAWSDTDRFERICTTDGLYASNDGDTYSVTVPDPRTLDPRAAVVVMVAVGSDIFGGRQPGSVLRGPLSHTGGQLRATWCVGVPDQRPVGRTLITKVDGRGVGVFGYAYDPENPSARLTIDVSLDRTRVQTIANDFQWTAKDPFPNEASNHGYLSLIANVPPGDHELCFVTEDPKDLVDVYGTGVGVPDRIGVGCTRFTVK